MGKGKTNKRKGSNAERLYAKLFRELGFSFCKTARQESRVTDDAGIDLTNLPFNVQIKAGYHKGMNPAKVLGIIDERLPILFPPEDIIHTKPNILIHRNQIGPGNRRVAEDDLVYLKVEDFIELVKKSENIKDRAYLYIDIIGNKKKGVSYKEILSKQGHFNKVKVIHHHRPKSTNPDYSRLAIMSFEFFKTVIIKQI